MQEPRNEPNANRRAGNAIYDPANRAHRRDFGQDARRAPDRRAVPLEDYEAPRAHRETPRRGSHARDDSQG